MKNKLLKIIFGIILFIAFYAIATNVKAVTIKENVNDYDDDIYLIGTTRFDPNVVITVTRAAQAGMDQAKVNLALGKELAGLEIATYHYDALGGDWYELRGQKFELLTKTESEKVEANLDVFFVNNEEKKLEFPYVGNVKKDTITAGVTYDGAKFTVPATQFTFNFETEDGAQQTVLTNTTIVDNEKEVEYGDFYIPHIVSVYDAIGGNKIGTAQTTKEGYIDETGLYDDKKTGWKLCYTDDTGAIIDFKTKKVNDDNYSIYKKWIPEGYLSIGDETYENTKITYNGKLTINTSDENKHDITVKLYAPEGYDTTNTTITSKGNFNTLKGENDYVSIKLTFASKEEVKTIDVTWEDGITTQFKISLGEDAKFQRKIKYYTSVGTATPAYTKYAYDGTKPNNIKLKDKAKQGLLFAGWSLSDGGELYDMNTPVSSNMTLYVKYDELPKIDFTNMRNFILGECKDFKVYVNPNDFPDEYNVDANLKVYNSSTKKYEPITYDENNYMEVLVNGEYKREFKDVPITLSKDNMEKNAIEYRIKLSNLEYSSAPIRIEYKLKKQDKILYEGNNSNVVKAIERENIAADWNGGYYEEKDIPSYCKKSGTVKLWKDITLNQKWNFSNGGQNIILDLNGHTITSNFPPKDPKKPSALIYFQVKGSLTIKNGKLIAKDGNFAIAMGKNNSGSDTTNVTIGNDVEIETNQDAIQVYGKNSVLNIYGKIKVEPKATDTTKDSRAIMGNGGSGQNTTINIYDGAEIVAEQGLAFFLPQYGTLNIYGGTMRANTVMEVKSGKVNILGGILNATGAKEEPSEGSDGSTVTGDVIYVVVRDNYDKNIAIDIKGGTLTSQNGNIIQILKYNGATDDVIVNSNYTSATDLAKPDIIIYN